MTSEKFKERWVCFDCRKMSRILRQVEDAKPGVRPESPRKNCPKCQAAMCNIGSFFAPPPKDNLRRWQAAAMAAAAGFHCHSVGASRLFWEIVGSERPGLQDVADRIAQFRVQRDNGGQLLKSIEHRRKP